MSKLAVVLTGKYPKRLRVVPWALAGGETPSARAQRDRLAADTPQSRRYTQAVLQFVFQPELMQPHYTRH